jgi:hypothetical protein
MMHIAIFVCEDCSLASRARQNSLGPIHHLHCSHYQNIQRTIHVQKALPKWFIVCFVSILLNHCSLDVKGPGWLNELGSRITQQVIQAYHQYGVGSSPPL